MEQELELLVDDKTKKPIFRCYAIDVKRHKQIARYTTLNALLLEGVRYILNKYETTKRNEFFLQY